MRNLLGPLLCRASASALVLAPVRAPGTTRTTAEPSPEAPRIPFAERHHALPRGGFARAGNASVSCRTTPGEPSEPRRQAAREGQIPAVNEDFDMSCIAVAVAVDGDGDLPAGEQQPAADDGRVLIAEPGGGYEELPADPVVGHRAAGGADAFQASADVTEWVRSSGSGLWTVGLRDGFDSRDTPAGVRPNGLHAPRGAGSRAGLVAYNGGRGGSGDSLTCTTAGHAPVPLQGSADPADDVLNSTINEPGPVRARREPAYASTLGYDSDVFDPGTGLAHGGDQLTLRLVSQRDAAWAGALFAAVDAR
ncbi:DUF3344 domain-containing protein [Streptomyces sp. NPDC001797]|uniref:DUF3344 domain-containing protein n=1 Tax=Streptomyces sp. NPDC001797 TaxID=3364610 RepID=UPI0036A4E4F1